MSDPQSRFILAAYRPDGSDADDPAMKEAIEQFASDPEARARFEEQVAFDQMVAKAVAGIPVPEELHDEIIAGAKFSSPRQNRWKLPTSTWLPLAATLAALAAATAMLFTPENATADNEWVTPSLEAIQSVGSGSGADTVTNADVETTQNWLKSHLGADLLLPPQLANYPSKICEVIEQDDGKIYLVCFDAGDGTVLHLAVYQGSDVGREQLPVIAPDASGIAVSSETDYEYARWQDHSHRYLLAASHSSKPCCARLREVVAAIKI